MNASTLNVTASPASPASPGEGGECSPPLYRGEPSGKHPATQGFPPPQNGGTQPEVIHRDVIHRRLVDLRTRGIAIAVTPDGTVQTTGPATHADTTWIARHAHALRVAATGNHARWWSAVVAGIAQHAGLAGNDLPVALDNPWEWACASCGLTAAHVDEHVVPWCDACRTGA